MKRRPLKHLKDSYRWWQAWMYPLGQRKKVFIFARSVEHARSLCAKHKVAPFGARPERFSLARRGGLVAPRGIEPESMEAIWITVNSAKHQYEKFL